MTDALNATIADARARLVALTAEPTHPEVPGLLHALGRAHVSLGLRSSDRVTAINQLWWGSDVLVALVSVGLPPGPSDLFFDGHYFTFGTIASSPWSTGSVWLDAFHATIVSGRDENVSRLRGLLPKLRGDEPRALSYYGRGLFAVLDGAPDEDGDVFTYGRRARRELATATPAWSARLAQRLDAWEPLLEHGAADAFAERVARIADVEEPGGIDAGTGVSLEASAMLALARHRYRVDVKHPRIRTLHTR